MADWTIIKTLTWTESYFKKQSRPAEPGNSDSDQSTRPFIDSPRLTAEILLAFSLGIQRLDLYLQYDRPLTKNELAAFKVLIKRRLAGEPVAYITGTKGFYESDFHVAPGVLIPRPDTETLVENALALLSGDSDTISGSKSCKKVLELGVGSGAIIVSLAKASPEHRYFGSDLSSSAIKVARKNAEILADNRICFFVGEWFDAVRETDCFDLIVSNPPYIPTAQIGGLQTEICRFEPMLALDGGQDGLDAYRIILERAFFHLAPGGLLLLEIGYDQQAGLQSVFNQCSGYESIAFIRDLAGHNRVVKIKKTD